MNGITNVRMRRRSLVVTRGRSLVGFSPAPAASGRIATVGQLLFEPWAWAYSTLHPLRAGK